MSEDFDNCISSQQGQVGKVIDTLTELVDKIEDAFKGLEVDNKMPSLREAHQEFVAALVTYRDTVLHDILAQSRAMNFLACRCGTFRGSKRSVKNEIRFSYSN